MEKFTSSLEKFTKLARRPGIMRLSAFGAEGFDLLPTPPNFGKTSCGHPQVPEPTCKLCKYKNTENTKIRKILNGGAKSQTLHPNCSA